MAASANSGRPALSSIPGTATIAATAVVARPNLNSALIGKRIDGPLDTLALGPICHKGFALPLCLRRHFEEKLNQSFKKLVISGTATVFGSRVEALPLCGPRSPAALYGLAAARVVANRRAGGPDSIRDPANGGRGKIGRRDSAGTRRAHDRSGKPGRKYFSGGGKFCSGRRDLDQWRPAECALSCMCLIVGGQAVSQDYVAAHMWFNLAAAGGVKDAPTNRDLVAAKMTPQQIAEAEKRFTEWRPSGPIL